MNPVTMESVANRYRRQRNPLSSTFSTVIIECMTNASRLTNHRPVQLDDVSKAIIEQLQADGRRSYADIGKAVGLSEAAVRQRVQRLTESGVMQIVAVTDPMQLGFTRQAMIGIRAAGDTRELAEELAAIPEIDYVVLTAGSFDLLAEVVCENDEQLISLLNSKIRALDGVQTTETFVYLKLQKQFYNWGTR
ncbi:transcriptional regulator, AsnC family [Agromyces flavus]|uniref:Transcriptional regulator, AsnC family n=2 Tax=Agromyces flavus TaxID=589382 RepID=A0A1H1TWG0_9MICO|nr:transcriptional regulator, AsnC family [Agromyces flavus]